jgi:hypothetical protein
METPLDLKLQFSHNIFHIHLSFDLVFVLSNLILEPFLQVLNRIKIWRLCRLHHNIDFLIPQVILNDFSCMLRGIILLHNYFIPILSSYPIIEWNKESFEYPIVAFCSYILSIREDIKRAHFISTKTTPYSYYNPPRLKRRSEVLGSIFLSSPRAFCHIEYRPISPNLKYNLITPTNPPRITFLSGYSRR